MRIRESIPAASAPESPTASPPNARSKSSKGKTVQLALPVVEPTIAPPAAKAPAAGEVLAQEKAELHLYDVASGTFILQDSEVTVSVWEIDTWECEYFAELNVTA